MDQTEETREAFEKRIVEMFRVPGGPMSEGETKFLRGVQAFIDFAIRNGLSFHATMVYLSHDWNELARYGFDFETPIKKGFWPRVYDFSEKSGDAVGEPEPEQSAR